MRNYNQFTQTERYQIYALRKANKILRKSIGSWDVIKVPSIGNWSAILGNEATVLSKHINLLLNDTWVAIVVEFLWKIGSWSNLWFAGTGVRNKSAYGWRNIKKSGSVTSGSISIFWRISPKQEISTLTCTQGKNAKNVTTVRTAEEWF